MELIFTDINEFEEYYNNPDTATLLCSTAYDCGNVLEMHLGHCSVDIGEYHTDMNECPIMRCNKCGKEQLCPNIPQKIYYTYFQMQKKRSNVCRLTIKSDERFHSYLYVTEF